MQDGFLELPMGQAAALAHALGGSLDWLAERALDRGAPSPAAVSFDGDEFKQRRRAAGIPEARVREVLGLPLGPYRSLASGAWEPTLGQVLHLADLQQVAAAALVA